MYNYLHPQKRFCQCCIYACVVITFTIILTCMVTSLDDIQALRKSLETLTEVSAGKSIVDMLKEVLHLNDDYGFVCQCRLAYWELVNTKNFAFGIIVNNLYMAKCI